MGKHSAKHKGFSPITLIALLVFILVAVAIGIKENPFHRRVATISVKENSSVKSDESSLPSSQEKLSSFVSTDASTLTIPLKNPNAFTFDFNIIPTEMNKHAAFKMRGLYLQYVGGTGPNNTDPNPAVAFFFTPSGALTDLHCIFSAPKKKHYAGEASDDYPPEYGVSAYSPTISGTSWAELSPNAPSSVSALQISGGHPYPLFTGAVPFQQFSQWYSSLPLQEIIQDYSAGTPTAYLFVSASLTSTDLQKPGVHVTFLECSKGQVKKVNPADLEGSPKSGEPTIIHFKNKICFTIAPYYNQAATQTGIWPQSYTTYTPSAIPGKEALAVKHPQVANNLIVLLMDYQS